MTPLLTSGLQLMLVGMGTVFAFLTLLVVATMGMSRLVTRFAPVTGEAKKQNLAASDHVSEAEVAAITTAITLHRNR